ncbi:MAG: hypothetical protein RLZZ308_141 [Candidatus Parcubacteria bacterium]|jgi:hypothetical protein
MGLKYGLAALVAKKGLFLKLQPDGRHTTRFARVVREGDMLMLHYTNGDTGLLRLNASMQLEVPFVCFGGSQPIVDYPEKDDDPRIIFNGAYEVREIPSSELLPQAEHTSLHERFANPKTLWGQVIANMVV